MSHKKQTRRNFLSTTARAATAAATIPYFFTSGRLFGDDAKAESANDRPILGCIGTGSRWDAVGPNAMKFSDCVAVCDVDREHASKAHDRVKKEQNSEPDVYEDYRQVLDRKDIDVVAIVTPDHWHTKIAIEAMQAGKDVYCEKPLTLTIEEGKQICQVVKQTGRVFQVGTQQRSEMDLRFLKTVALIHGGRIGNVERVTCVIGGAPASGPIPVADPPSHLNWNLWLGQAPLVAFRHREPAAAGDKKKKEKAKTRCHYEFRWWYEYSGGKMTDWGAHHVDIAQWAIRQDGEDQGPTSIEPVMVKHPVEFKDGYPTDDSQYNAATHFTVKCTFPNGVELFIREKASELFDTAEGIIFEGTNGTLRVSRRKLEGDPIDALDDNPLPEDELSKAYKGKTPGGPNAHMRDFFECVKTRDGTIADVFSHHRAMTTCHLANIAIRLGRTLQWDPITQQIVGDDDANSWQRREQRQGFEINV